jgi:hypothetical protein
MLSQPDSEVHKVLECCGISLQETRRFDLYQFRPVTIAS